MARRLAHALLLASTMLAIPSGSSATPSAPQIVGRLKVSKLDEEPKEGHDKPGAAKLGELRKAVDAAPEERMRRFELVRGLIAEGDAKSALVEAEAWRARDAYDLVVVRIIGDLHLALGDVGKARRTYSSVVELLPKDPEAHRALATVLKVGGDLTGAHARMKDAVKLRPDDPRLAFELADLAQRLGHAKEAEERLEAIVKETKTPESIRYPAKQRLAQLWSAKKRESPALAADYGKRIEALGIHGGVENDLKVYLTWDTDRTDVDLWVETPSKERVWYEHRTSKHGDALYDDVTSGYGPESFTAKSAEPGTYTVSVNYFGTSRTLFAEARGEVVVIVHEGQKDEQRSVFPFRIWKPKQTVTVAKVEVKP